MQSANSNPANSLWHGTTILTVRKAGIVAVGGDGQVSIGQTIVKANAKKVRQLGKGDVIGGFAGATADAFTLFERLEAKLEQYPGQLTRAAVELAKDWRTDRYLRRLEAMMIVADKDVSLVLTGTGDVWSRKPASPASVREAITRWPRRGRCSMVRSMPKRSCAVRSISRPTSASTPIAMSRSKHCGAPEDGAACLCFQGDDRSRPAPDPRLAGPAPCRRMVGRSRTSNTH